MGRYLSTSETAELLSTTVGVLANWRHHAEGPIYIKLKRKILYDIDDLQMWLQNKKVKTVDDTDIL